MDIVRHSCANIWWVRLPAEALTKTPQLRILEEMGMWALLQHRAGCQPQGLCSETLGQAQPVDTHLLLQLLCTTRDSQAAWPPTLVSTSARLLSVTSPSC